MRNAHTHAATAFHRTGGACPRRRPAVALLLLLGLLVLGIALPAMAQSLDQLRASGAVGERYDGLVEARSSDGAVRSVVDTVNAQRQGIYAKRAAEQGVSVDQVGRVYALEIFRSAPSGTYFLQENGQWVRK